MGIINFSSPVTGNFIADIIAWLVQIGASVVLGVILFTLLLKLITLPFDYFSRASMRKNSLKMEEMRPELEKLQKQYANDKQLYNQKMMALYKKNGYSMFGACLPTIITLVIFIIALNGFTTYSQYQNRVYFYNMSCSYNNVIYSGFELEGNEEYFSRNDKGVLVIDYDKLISAYGDSQGEVKIEDSSILVTYNKVERSFVTAEEKQSAIDNGEDLFNRALKVRTENGYVYVNKNFSYSNYVSEDSKGDIKWSTETYYPIEEGLINATLISKENNELKNEAGKTYTEAKVLAIADAKKVAEEKEETFDEQAFSKQFANDFILDIQQLMSAKTYRTEQASFLWVKNIWVTDSSLAHPVGSDWNSFKTANAYPVNGEDIKAEGYNNLTAKLSVEKTQPNGYFILVVLTAGISLLMQLVMNKSQKAQMELQTVDGQGAQTQKMLTFMMPVMMAVFAFMYTSAFSIYIILSNLISMLTTVIINKIVDYKFKKEKSKNGQNAEVVHGRVYTPKEEPKKEKPKKKKTNVPEGPDFLTGKGDNSSKIRGRR